MDLYSYHLRIRIWFTFSNEITKINQYYSIPLSKQIQMDSDIKRKHTELSNKYKCANGLILKGCNKYTAVKVIGIL